VVEAQIVALAGTAGALLSAVVAALVRMSCKDRQAVWAQAAAERNATYHPGRGWLALDPGRITLEVGGATIDIRRSGTGSRGRMTAAAGVPIFSIHRGAFLEPPQRAHMLGTHPFFDKQFVVLGQNRAALRRLWSAGALERVARHLTSPEISSDGRVIELTEPGIWNERAPLLAVLDILAELGARDVFGAAALRAVRGARFVDGPPGGSPRAELDVPARVAIAAEDVDGALVTVARLGEDPGLDPMRLEVAASGRLADPGLAGALPQGAHLHLPRTGAGRLILEPGSARFEWADVELDPERLRGGADLLAALCAGGPGGVYR
jgi:hypothetical protein